MNDLIQQHMNGSAQASYE
ncbi:unnamed protein product, partial [Rotaria sp. Silwood1]